MRRRYWVDWWADDPQIRSEGDAGEYETLMTFAEARAKIVEHFQSRIDHARMMIRQTRQLRVADVQPEADRD